MAGHVGRVDYSRYNTCTVAEDHSDVLSDTDTHQNRPSVPSLISMHAEVCGQKTEAKGDRDLTVCKKWKRVLQHEELHRGEEAISQCFKSVRTTTGQFRAAWADSAESSELRFVTSFILSLNEGHNVELALAADEGVRDYKASGKWYNDSRKAAWAEKLTLSRVLFI